MRKVLSVAVTALIIIATGAVVVDVSTAFSFFQNSNDNIQAYFFIVDTSPSMAEEIDALKSSANALINTIQTESSTMLGLASFNFSGAENEEGGEDLHLSLTEHTQSFRNAVNNLVPSQQTNTLSFALEHVLSTEIATKPNIDACLVIISDMQFDSVSINSESSASLPVRIALVGTATSEQAEDDLLERYALETLLSDSVGLYQQLASYCSEGLESESTEEVTGSQEPASEAEGQPEKKAITGAAAEESEAETETQPEPVEDTEPEAEPQDEAAGSEPESQTETDAQSENVQPEEPQPESEPEMDAEVENPAEDAVQDQQAEEVEPEVSTDPEAILQRHEADIALLKQNLSALSALLANVPVLEGLQSRLFANEEHLANQEILLSESATSIADLGSRLAAVELETARIDALEASLGQISALDQELANTSQELSAIESRLAKTENDLSALPISDHEARLTALEQNAAEIMALESELVDLRFDLTQTTSHLEALQSQVDGLPIAQMSARIGEINSEMTDGLRELRANISQLELNAADAERKSMALESRVADLEASLSQLPIEEIEKNITMLGSEVVAINSVNEVQTQRLADAESELERLVDLSERITSNEEEIALLNRLVERVDNIEESHREYSRKLMGNTDKIEALDAFSLQLADSIRAIRTDLDRLAAMSRALDVRTDELETRMITDEIELSGRIELLETSLETINDDIARVLENTLTRVEYHQSAEQQRIEDLDRDRILGELTDEIDALMSEVRMMRGIFSSMNEDTRATLVANFTRDYRQMQRDVQQLRTAVVVLAAGLVAGALAVIYVMR